MNFKLGKVVSYIGRSGENIKKAAGEFFGKNEIYPNIPDWENISSLFNEWLVFDYKLVGDTTIASDYYLKNPDKLSPDLMDEMILLAASCEVSHLSSRAKSRNLPT